VTLSVGFVAAALAWSAFAVPALVKYPTDLNVTTRAQGVFTVFVDPTTTAPLATPEQVPLDIERHVDALGDESGASRVVVEETITQRAGDIFDATQTNAYVMDRRTLQNVADERAYAFEPSNVVDRSGTYRLNLPFDTSADSTYQIYKNEIGTTYEARADTTTPTSDVAGLHLHNFTASAKEVPLDHVYLSELNKIVSLPESLTLDQLEPQLQAAGVDVDGVLSALAPVITADDLATLAKLASQPIPLQYVLSFDGTVGVETATGAEVDVDATEWVGAKPVLADADAVQAVFAHYPDVPEAVAAGDALAALRSAPATKLFEYSYEQTPASVADVADEVRARRNQIRLVELYVPVGLFAAAALSLALAAFLYWRRSRRVGRGDETVREAIGPDMKPLPVTAHLLEPVIERADRDPRRVVAAHRDGDRFVDVTAGEFYERVRRLAKGLIGYGVHVGDRVVLMSHTRLEWMLVDYAILAAGGVTVPAYETSSTDQLQWILSDSEAVAIILETPEMAEMHAVIAHETPSCHTSLVLDQGGLDELARRGETVDDAALDERIARLTTDRLATIVYTSGTTGRPKGCAITHGNLRTNVLQNLDAVCSMLEPEEVGLVFLPLAHTFTKTVALVGVERGIKMAFATDITHLREELASVRPTMIVAVPRVFEKVFNGAQHKARAEGHGRIFDKATGVAIRWSEQHAAGRVRLMTRIAHVVLDRLVYRKVQAAFGGRVRFAISGGAPLGERLTHFFNGVGVKIFEGYGLTETSPTLTVNRADAWKPGTVGQPLAATSIRIAADGEVLVKGPQVFQGYWHNESATAEVFDDDGWFLTGDIGTLDEDGFLRITGRKKELIVTAAGKNVAPAPLEDRLRAHPLISHAVVVGDARPFIAALITLDPEAITQWATERGVSDVALTELAANVDLQATIQSAVEDANRSVSRAESIRKVALLPVDLTIAAGELTPTLKVRRAVVEKHYADVIKELYGDLTADDATSSHVSDLQLERQ
jgi:long-chain acyl-CoA synthetase